MINICYILLADDATKRKQMEDLVKQELEHWDDASRPGTTEMGRN